MKLNNIKKAFILLPRDEPGGTCSFLDLENQRVSAKLSCQISASAHIPSRGHDSVLEQDACAAVLTILELALLHLQALGY
mmetsp:Transcript_24584/g.35260  ORF Transcript_24584/g.35260 Transcript_24584/m.35260 type:complete len:80 (+) Transcript_24584:1888-2127(+)